MWTRRRRTWALFSVGAGVASLMAGLGACMQGETTGDVAGIWDGAGASSHTGTTTTSTTTNWGAGGGSEVLPPDPGAGGTGGTGGGPTCESLDSSQPLVLYISADDSNSMASPAHARELLLGSKSLSYLSIRTYEFLNYYHIDYPSPPQSQLAIFAQAEDGAEPGTLDLQLAVRSFDAPHPRRPMTITFVLDTSGSMAGTSIERERAVVRAVAKSLAPGDVVNMVTWSNVQAAILSGHIATGANDATVLAAANQLAAGGSTDLYGGLSAGYALANQYYGLTRLNRLILVSDGGANTGITDEQLIAQNSEDADQEGIYLVGVGTGPATGYNDFLMDTVTDKGRGAYVYIDSVAEAERIFVDRFDETMEIAARAVQVKLTLPWYYQMMKFYGEEYSPDPTVIEPQHLAPGDAMIFNQVIAACDPDIVNGEDTVTVDVSWTVPLTYQSAATSLTMSIDELRASPKEALHKGKAIVAYAEALKTGLSADLHAAHDAVMAIDPDAELSEIADLLEHHPAY